MNSLRNILIIGFLSFIPALTGCTTATQGQTEQQQYQQEKAQCNQVPLTKENAAQRQDCVNKSLIYHAMRTGVPASVIYQRTAADTQSAVAYSEGHITAPEYQVALEQHEAEFIREGTAVLSAQQQQQSQNWSNAMGGIANAFQRPQPAPPPSAPKNTFCVPISGGVSCTPAP